MIQAILYKSNTGTTAEYAKLLGKKTGLPVYPLNDAAVVQSGAEVIYLGWVMASSVNGYKKAVKRYRVRAVCGVCMGATGSQLPELRKQNAVPENVPVFTMRGGFNISKLRGIYRFMMSIMMKTAGKKLSQKSDRTPEDDIMLEMMLHGGNYVSEDNLKDVLDWYATCEAKGE